MSAFYDQASLVVVPSGYKSGKIYAQKPLTTDGQLTFTRASTATRVNASGLIETVSSGVPRLDYLGSTCPKLLLEPQRTNLVTYSEQMDNAAWSKTNVSVTANTSVSPDGSTNADTILSTAASPQLLTSVITFGATTNVSVFVKYVSQRFVQLFGGGAFGDFANFDIQNAVVGTSGASTTNAKIENYGNGWLRISATFSGFAGATTARIGFVSALNSGWNSLDPSFNKSVLAYGFQAEVGAYATSYVKTEASAVTRVEDAAYKTGISSLIGQTEGTIFFEVDKTLRIDNDYRVQISDGTTSNWLFISLEVGNNIRLYCNTGGVNQFSVYGSAVTSGRHKIAMAYKANDFKVYVDGVAWITQTSGSVPACSKFNLGSPAPTVDAANTDSKTSQALLFKTRLTNAQLAELTAL